LQSKYRYRMVNFPASFLLSKKDPTAVSNKLEEIVYGWAEKGWEFYRMDRFEIEVSQGCLGRLFGWTSERYYDYVITFRIDVTHRPNHVVMPSQ